MNSTKPILAIVSGGVLLGAALGNMAYPQMKFAEGADWRARLAPRYSTASTQFVDAGPQDLSPTWHGPVYDGPNYQPAAFASDQDWEYEHLMADSYLAEDRHSSYGSYDSYRASLEDAPGDMAPSVPLGVERASEEAAKVAAEMVDLPVRITSGSDSPASRPSNSPQASLR